jgi:hypothetical protein
MTAHPSITSKLLNENHSESFRFVISTVYVLFQSKPLSQYRICFESNTVEKSLIEVTLGDPSLKGVNVALFGPWLLLSEPYKKKAVVLLRVKERV